MNSFQTNYIIKKLSEYGFKKHGKFDDEVYLQDFLNPQRFDYTPFV